MTETAKTTEQGEWLVVMNGGSVVVAERAKLIRVKDPFGSGAEELHSKTEAAKHDPANVLIVSAYPRAVKALHLAKEALRGDGDCDEAMHRINQSLAAVHPQGDKT